MSTNTKKDFPDFRRRLNKLRDYYGDNITFSQAIGLHRQTVGAYLNGDRIPDIKNLVKIVKATGVSADWLLGLSKAKTPDATLQAASSYTGLSEDSLKQIKKWSSSSHTYGHVLDLLIRFCASDVKVFYHLDRLFRYVHLLSLSADSGLAESSSKERFEDYEMREEIAGLLERMHSRDYVLIKRDEFISALRFRASNDFDLLMDYLVTAAESGKDDENIPILSDEDILSEQLDYMDVFNEEPPEGLTEEEKPGTDNRMRKAFEKSRKIQKAKEKSLKPNPEDN